MLDSLVDDETPRLGTLGFNSNSTFLLVLCKLLVLVEEVTEDNNASSLKVTSLLRINLRDLGLEHHKRYPLDLDA